VVLRLFVGVPIGVVAFVVVEPNTFSSVASLQQLNHLSRC
jgi:hypothetical protein